MAVGGYADWPTGLASMKIVFRALDEGCASGEQQVAADGAPAAGLLEMLACVLATAGRLFPANAWKLCCAGFRVHTSW